MAGIVAAGFPSIDAERPEDARTLVTCVLTVGRRGCRPQAAGGRGEREGAVGLTSGLARLLTDSVRGRRHADRYSDADAFLAGLNAQPVWECMKACDLWSHFYLNSTADRRRIQCLFNVMTLEEPTIRCRIQVKLRALLVTRSFPGCLTVFQL